jgi:hypothetical protein
MPVTFAAVSTVLGQRCGSIGCHSAMNGRPPALAAGAMLHSTLMTRTVARCGGDPLVIPNDPSKSALVKLVNKACGTFVMPPGAANTPSIPAADLTTITSWISAGAPQ